MATIATSQRSRRSGDVLPVLEPGDHLDQPTFHARYAQMPEDIKAELIGGMVFMPAALRSPHSDYHSLLVTWLRIYKAATPGTHSLLDATIVLGDDSEPQPDAGLRIVDGQSHKSDDEYIVGAPELVAEVASASESYDLHAKRNDYERWGVQEYLVFVLREKRLVWLIRRDNQFAELPPDADGIFRSVQFPGLWLDPEAFFREDDARVQAVLADGLKSAQHAAFVARLAKTQNRDV